MPNWCLNKLILKHDDPQKIKEVADAYNNELLLTYFIPCPKELSNEELTTYSRDEAEYYNGLRKKMKEQYGYESWREWCLTHWGTKWEISTSGAEVEIEDGDTRIELFFDTAWSPPIEAMKVAEEQGFTVDLQFAEPGNNFCGSYADGDENVVPADSPIGKVFVEQFIY